MPIITINGNSLNVASKASPQGLAAQPVSAEAADAAPPGQATDASKSDYVLVGTESPLSTHQTVELKNIGLVTHKYVSENTYLYGYKKSDLKVIRDLPFVAFANVYPLEFVIAPDLKGDATALPKGHPHAPKLTAAAPQYKTPIEVDIIFHRDVDSTSDKVQKDVEGAAGGNATIESDSVSPGKMRLSVKSANDLTAIAKLDAVQFIHKVYPAKLHNNVARGILQAEDLTNPSPYKGLGQTVAVADTGFDRGSTNPNVIHPAFTGRVKKLYAFGRRNPDKVDDRNGHGTHVAGSVLGDGIARDPLSSTLADRSTVHASRGGKIQGTAPQATLVLQSLMTADNDVEPPLDVPNNLEKLFLPPYINDQARIHTNSWGTPWQGFQQTYNTSSTEIDRFVWQHPDMVILFSAGNDGSDQMLTAAPESAPIAGEIADGIVDLGSVGEYASAKNCIAVGASESVRSEITPTWGKFWPSKFPEDPLFKDKMADSKDGMAAFSSRGPTNHRDPDAHKQRYKPDLVAPGSWILSARSRAAVAESTGWGLTSDRDWFWEGGTSMACPLVAGCAAVVRESLVKNGAPKPSAALVKALLINGADELRGQYLVSEAGTSPNNNSGFGIVNLKQSVVGSQGNVGFVEGGPLVQGAKEVHVVARAATGGVGTFKVTLVWSDPAGEMLQNDLDLIVVASDGVERHGNMAPGSLDFDRVNNVEQVVLENLPAGDVTVVVKAFQITDGPDLNDGPQPYALAWRWI